MKQLFLMIGFFGIMETLSAAPGPMVQVTGSSVTLVPVVGSSVTLVPLVPVPTPQPRVYPTPAPAKSPLPIVTASVVAKASSAVMGSSVTLVFNFGAKLIGTEIEHTFSFPNTTKVPIVIKAVIPSCRCTEVTQFTHLIQPGSIGTIAFRTQMDQAGHKAVNLTAELGSGTSQIFQISGEVIPLLVSLPKPVDASEFVDPAALALASRTSAAEFKAVTFLDMRPAAQYVLAHIPNAINLPAFGLQARSNLSHNTLILVSSGVDDLALDLQVKACRLAGFTSIRYLKGGMRLWQQNGGTLTGVSWQKPTLHLVQSSEVVQSARHSVWTLLVPKSVPVTTEQPSLCSVVYYKGKSDLQAKLNHVTAGNVALFAPENDQVTLASMLNFSHSCPAFFVTDSWSNYVQVATVESLAQAPLTVSVSSGSTAHRIKNCPTCP